MNGYVVYACGGLLTHTSLLTKGLIMKRFSIFSVVVATVGMTCLVGYASATNSAPGEVIPDSMLLADSETVAPGGRGGGTAGEAGRADKGTPNEDRLQGTPGVNTSEKARPRTEKDAGKEGNTRSESGKTGTSSGSPGSGSGPSSGAGSGAK
jgi:hypothetical protein